LAWIGERRDVRVGEVSRQRYARNRGIDYPHIPGRRCSTAEAKLVKAPVRHTGERVF
jgi:hypothetical protein